ncbi:hypothetical protein [Lacrimispora xylanisolvens]|uniref:hypothetical protein n=1 Tax=Lacrimispora xylanisolvens TaxID=384636 RepID=UPI002402D506
MRLMLQHKKELHETEIEIKYPEMTERVAKLIQCIRQYDMEIDGFKDNKAYQYHVVFILFFDIKINTVIYY